MSGHSHWAGIKHKKALVDAKRGKVFGKLAKIISLAAREKGGDPGMNPRLRIAIETAQGANMPKENIERAIKRGTGELEGVKLEEITLEIYGPQGVAILVEGITDNKNRTLSEMKKLLTEHQAKLATEGSVRWMFHQKGAISIKTEGATNHDELELTAIDAGAEDTSWDEEEFTVFTAPENMDTLKQNLESKGLHVDSASLQWLPQTPIQVDEKRREKLEKLFEALDEHEDVQEIYSNVAS